jgi:anaerobic selenocysteine-containing dehydrogenase
MTVREDVWIPSTCDMCYNHCNIRVRRQDGVVVKIEGLDAAPNFGKTCAKGNAAFMNAYSPHRVKAPMVRTNPDKGVDIDPGWREITWPEAMDLMVQKLSAARAKDPRGVVLATFDVISQPFVFAWMGAVGSPNQSTLSAGFFCGNGVHPIAYALTGAFDVHHDIERCQFFMMFGASFGFVSQTDAMGMALEMAEARSRGMKLVVVDPVCTQAASQADEWVPIRPGTDAAMALAMQHVLLNEIGVYDSPFLRRYTNAAYLVGADGHYVRDSVTGRPLVWDTATDAPVPFDEVDPNGVALEGEYSIDGVPVAPGFERIRGNAGEWTPERAAEITTVPAQTIRRLAREFADAASIGARITIDGYDLPYRPAIAAWYRGTSAHQHGMHTCMSIAQLNVLIGAIDVPGGVRHGGATGPSWGPKEGPDGLLVQGPGPRLRRAPHAYDFRVRPPETLELVELFPLAIYARAMIWMGILYAEQYGITYAPEVLIQCRTNVMATGGDPIIMAEALRRIPFMVSFSVFEDETTRFADLLLPDAHSLERLVPMPTNPYTDPTAHPRQGQPVIFQSQLPAMAPQGQARYWVEVLYELADRLGIRGDLNTLLNVSFGLDDRHRFEGDQSYAFDEMFDRIARSRCGDEHGYAYFQQHGYYAGARFSVPEAYPRVFHTARVPLYLEHFLTAGEQVREFVENRELDWDTGDYVPLLHWRPCSAASRGGDAYDLYVVNHKISFMTHSFTAENPWLTELAEHTGKVYTVGINAETARRKRIGDGDWIELSTADGAVARAQARVTQGVHPECLSVPGILGRRIAGLRQEVGKGVHFNSLLRGNTERMDMVSAALDSCVKVRVRRISSKDG